MLEAYLSTLFGTDDVGYVYAPWKKLSDGNFHKFFFPWPLYREQLTYHITERSKSGDIFISPVLWKDEKFTFKQSNVVWADFDSGLPEGPFELPSLRVYSSGYSDKQHWYWNLREPITDPEVLEDYNRRIAYSLGGDKVAWNRTRVLRPP